MTKLRLSSTNEGFFAFERVPDELKAPADGEHRGGQGKADNGGTDGETEGNERNADFVTRLVSRVTMVVLVFVQEPCPCGIELNHGFLVVSFFKDERTCRVRLRRSFFRARGVRSGA
jgi:hypothetical protein